MKRLMLGLGVTVTAAAILSSSVAGEDQRAALDTRVQAFLERHRGTWHDLNVPESDGRILHDLILEHKFTRALEIGTSTTLPDAVTTIDKTSRAGISISCKR
jgi:hypothetical protein